MLLFLFLEDTLWFILNPYFTIKRYTKKGESMCDLKRLANQAQLQANQAEKRAQEVERQAKNQLAR